MSKAIYFVINPKKKNSGFTILAGNSTKVTVEEFADSFDAAAEILSKAKDSIGGKQDFSRIPPHSISRKSRLYALPDDLLADCIDAQFLQQNAVEITGLN